MLHLPSGVGNPKLFRALLLSGRFFLCNELFCDPPLPGLNCTVDDVSTLLGRLPFIDLSWELIQFL